MLNPIDIGIIYYISSCPYPYYMCEYNESNSHSICCDMQASVPEGISLYKDMKQNVNYSTIADIHRKPLLYCFTRRFNRNDIGQSV